MRARPARRTRVRALTAGLLAVAVAGVLGVAAPAAPAQAAVGVTFAGRGYGHGWGMSQYGAKGRAEAGQTHMQIISAYYPGTSWGSVADTSAIRVWIQGDTDQQTWVKAETGLTVSGDSGPAVALPSTLGGAAVTQWRVRLQAGALVLEGEAGGTWRPADSASSAAVAAASTASFAAPDGIVQLVTGLRREYRGTVAAVRIGTGTSAVLRTVVTSALGQYLRSVVPAEMPALWHSNALAAQTVAARTYAVHDRDVDRNATWYDTCDTTSCQVYKGVRDVDASGAAVQTYENPRTDQAILTSANQVVLYGGKPAFTQFSASNGGHSAQGSQPYLVAQPDPYDAYPAWTAEVTGTRLQTAYPEIGGFTGIAVTARDGDGPWGGRATEVTIRGSQGTKVVTGAAFRSTFGLKSTLFVPTAVITPLLTPQRDWNADGGPDLIGRAPDGKLYLYRGLPGTTWARRVQIGQGWQTMRLMTQTHDFLGTGKPEIITTNTKGLLYVYPGDGRGSFGAPQRLGQGWTGFDLLVGVEGWHGAGLPGFVARKASTDQLLLYPGNGRGGFGTVRVLGTGWNQYDALIFAGDWDGDGRPDLMSRTATGALILHRGDGLGGFLGSSQIGQGWSGMDEIVGGADWNRDGRYDLIAREEGNGALWIYPGDGAGSFLARQQVGYGWTGFALVK